MSAWQLTRLPVTDEFFADVKPKQASHGMLGPSMLADVLGHVCSCDCSLQTLQLLDKQTKFDDVNGPCRLSQGRDTTWIGLCLSG